MLQRQSAWPRTIRCARVPLVKTRTPRERAEGGQIVVVLDLRRVLLPPEQAAGDVVHEGVAEGGPVAAREGDAVGVEAARRAAEFRAVVAGLEDGDALLEARREDGELLAEARRRRRLAVGPREHGQVAPLPGPRLERGDELLEARHQGVARALREHEGLGRVVHVLARQPEVDELLAHGRQAQRVPALLEVVLDRLDVVVRRPLDGLAPRGVGGPELGRDAAPLGQVAAGEDALERRHGAAQRHEVLDLDAHAVLDQSGLAEIGAHGRHAGRVAPVQRGQRIELEFLGHRAALGGRRGAKETAALRRGHTRGFVCA